MAAIGVTEKQAAQFLTSSCRWSRGSPTGPPRTSKPPAPTVRGILEGRTSEGIGDTAFGLIQAGTEWSWITTAGPATASSLFRRVLMRPNIAKIRMIDMVREVVPAAREVHILAA